MKRSMVENLFCLTALLAGLAGCSEKVSGSNDASGMSALGVRVNPVTLVSRYTGGDYATATYSFRYLTRDSVEATKNNWELLFEGQVGVEDTFVVNTVVSDNSFIYDLGKKSCADIQSTYPQDRKNRPLVWLGYSDANPSGLAPTKSAKVQEGHCYLTYSNDEGGRVVALFHVQSHEQDKAVTIDEIEVLDVLTRK